MTVLLDTHILLWILAGARRLKTTKWLEDFPYWTVSPVSLLEIKLLQECGRVNLELEKLVKKLREDERFRIDDLPLEELCLAAFPLSWTRDPFDRLLVAHSMVRRWPLGTSDRRIHEHYSHAI